MRDRTHDEAGMWPLSHPPTLGSPLPETMRALTIHRDRYASPSEALRPEQVPAPLLREADAKRVLVSILATGPNFNTNFASLGLPVPVFGKGDTATVHIPGSDALGIVVDAGAAVSRIKVGQAVILDSWTGRSIRGYETHDGFNAQFAIVDEERAIPLPPPLRGHTPERLAAMLLTYGTAYRAVVERLRVSPGDSVLFLGGGKGTSFAGAQIAKMLGARVILMGSNPELARSLTERGIADAFVDRRAIPAEVFGTVPVDSSHEEWLVRTEPFRQAVFAANGGRPVDKIFEHTGALNFPLLVSVLSKNGSLVFFGATGKGLKGEYKETFFCNGARFVFDARWVWMRQKQVLFRKSAPEAIFAEIGLPPGRKGLIWGADAYSRGFARAALARGTELAFVASHSSEEKGISSLRRMGIPRSRVIDRDGMQFPPDMPDPLTPDGKPNPEYAAGFLRNAQALGKAYWGIFGPRQSPDFIVERPDQSTLHYSTFILRDFDETNAMPCGFVVLRGKTNLSIHGSHMYRLDQAAEVIRLLAEGKIVMEQEDLEIGTLDGLPGIQQKMLEGTMNKPKGVALVQADRAGRAIREYEDAFLGEKILAADPKKNRFLDVRGVPGDIAIATLTRPDALNALNEELLSQFAAVVGELGSRGTIEGRPVRALVLTGAGRAFVAGADVKEFLGKSAAEVGALAMKNIAVFTELENLGIPVIAVVDGFALGGGNELAMSAHYRIVTENASLGQPEVKLGIIPGYGGMQRLPRLVGPERAARLCANGEPVDGHTAVSWGLADEFAPSATALALAVRKARRFLSEHALPRKDWDAIGGSQKEALGRLLDRPEIRGILAAPEPVPDEAKEIRAARKTAAGKALLAMRYGYENGFTAGLENDARAFGGITASATGQEWVGRFLNKDPLQSSFLELIPAEEK